MIRISSPSFADTEHHAGRSARVLLIRCGPGNGAEMAPEGTLASMACSLYEAAELTASCPASDDETARISEVVTNWNPELMLLLLSGGAFVQQGANFFELVRRNRWPVPVVVVCPPVKPTTGLSCSDLVLQRS